MRCRWCQAPKKPKVKAEKPAAAAADENGEPADGEYRRGSPVSLLPSELICAALSVVGLWNLLAWPALPTSHITADVLTG